MDESTKTGEQVLAELYGQVRALVQQGRRPTRLEIGRREAAALAASGMTDDDVRAAVGAMVAACQADQEN